MAKLVGVIFLFAITASNALALEWRKENDPQMKSTVTLVGRIQIFGNAPHTFAGIIDENGMEYAIYPPEQEERLRTLQGHLIEFTVVILDEPMGFGSLVLRGGDGDAVSVEHSAMRFEAII
ncbi:MAG: hypothetical protein FWB78_07205 [Treponema sp.]|nr:hypothetical protein [Treponema sp.]